jgi:hypothetical protein
MLRGAEKVPRTLITELYDCDLSASHPGLFAHKLISHLVGEYMAAGALFYTNKIPNFPTDNGRPTRQVMY